ncbi:MAG TPA: PAS domain-containing protein [Rhizomicrobium sp.]|nr:PAS domain-containing protein [Rhizomicrobium sp.]
MDVITAARALNQQASREKWFHICDPTLAFTNPVYDELLDLWRTKAGERKMPRRSDMTLRDLKNILRHLLIVERVEQNPSRYRFRLIGTSLATITGNVTNKMIDECVPAEHLPRWNNSCDLVLDGGQPLRFLGRVHLQGKEYLNAENLYVPLANDNDEPAFAMALCRYTPRDNDAEEAWENELASLPGGLF